MDTTPNPLPWYFVPRGGSFTKRRRTSQGSPERGSSEGRALHSPVQGLPRVLAAQPSDPPLPEVSWHGIRLAAHRPLKRSAASAGLPFGERTDIDHRTLDDNPPSGIQQQDFPNPLFRHARAPGGSERGSLDGGTYVMNAATVMMESLHRLFIMCNVVTKT